MRLSRFLLTALVASGLLFGLLAGAPSLAYQPTGGEVAQEPESGVHVEHPWVRPAMAGGNSALYMRLTNVSDEPMTLQAAATDVASTVELHETTLTTVTNPLGVPSQMMKMAEVSSVTVEPGETVGFQPGGLHVMLIDLNRPLHTGETIFVTLHFEGKPSVTIPVEVQAGPAGSNGHDHHDEHDHPHDHQDEHS